MFTVSTVYHYLHLYLWSLKLYNKQSYVYQMLYHYPVVIVVAIKFKLKGKHQFNESSIKK